MQNRADSPSSQELALLNGVIDAVARSRRMHREDAEDFHQTVHLKLVERGYDVFHKFSGKSTLRTYLLVVVHRMLLDWQNHHYGKWRPSVAARQLGPTAVLLDRLIDRDGYSIDQAITCLRAGGEPLAAEDLRRLAESLPCRRRRQVVATELAEQRQQHSFEDPVLKRQQESEAARARSVLRDELARLSAEDRRLITLRYRDRMTVRATADRLHADQKGLYRRFDRILLRLRRRLLARGVAAASALEHS